MRTRDQIAAKRRDYEQKMAQLDREEQRLESLPDEPTATYLAIQVQWSKFAPAAAALAGGSGLYDYAAVCVARPRLFGPNSSEGYRRWFLSGRPAVAASPQDASWGRVLAWLDRAFKYRVVALQTSGSDPGDWVFPAGKPAATVTVTDPKDLTGRSEYDPGWPPQDGGY